MAKNYKKAKNSLNSLFTTPKRYVKHVVFAHIFFKIKHKITKLAERNERIILNDLPEFQDP